MLNTKIKVGICGTTTRTVQCAEALIHHPHFEVLWVITPVPKPIGRKQTLTPSPLDTWAQEHGVEVKHVKEKLRELQTELLDSSQTKPVEILLVVDFGYLIPQWLLDLPTIAPVNIHPSDLPKYRGSSPGQFALLYGDTASAVCIMRLIWELDAGPIIARLPFQLSTGTTQAEYYAQAFELASGQLATVLQNYVAHQTEVAQPTEAPEPIAARLSREDGFFPNLVLENQSARKTEIVTFSAQPAEIFGQLSPTLQALISQQPDLSPAALLDRMVRAFSPWPGVWTIVPKHKGRQQVRLKILSGNYDLTNDTYSVTAWQYDGEPVQKI